MNQPIELSVVIPVFNSEHCLLELARQLHDVLHSLGYEIIFVDDNSHDGSWDTLVELVNDYPAFKAISLRKNCGQDCAIMAGLRLAKGEMIVIMDDDLQHSPQDIVILYEHCQKKEADVCFGKFVKKRQAWWKNIGSWLNGKLAEIVICKPKEIYLSPFKIMKMEIVEEIIKYRGSYAYI